MAKHLRDRLEEPWGDAFDIQATGDDERDRETLVLWLQRSVRSAPHCSPAWTAPFARSLAALVQAREEGDPLDIKRGSLLWSQQSDSNP